jgi:hypothetical protein
MLRPPPHFSFVLAFIFPRRPRATKKNKHKHGGGNRSRPEPSGEECEEKGCFVKKGRRRCYFPVSISIVPLRGLLSSLFYHCICFCLVLNPSARLYTVFNYQHEVHQHRGTCPAAPGQHGLGRALQADLVVGIGRLGRQLYASSLVKQRQ